MAATIGIGNGPVGIAAGFGEVWASNTTDGTVSVIDPSSNRVTKTIPVGTKPTGIAVGLGNVWVANIGDGTLSRIDPRPGRETSRFRVA